VVAQAGACRLGMSVCYDLRFPELYRQLADADAQVVVVPAAFTAATGRDHWELLLRARAVENQLFVIGANMVDREHARRGLWGGSAIIDPWGTVLARVDDKPGVAIAEIDLDRLTEIRGKMPVAQHRKL
jgi:predicted amidohydrolase